MQLYSVVALLAVAGSAFADYGIENCANKCDKVFDRTQYAISDQFRSCIIGCNRCSKELPGLPQHLNDGGCFNYCKNFNYAARNIRKGVIEPDKACIMGCVINTCQQVCTGGTTDHLVTPTNINSWWGLGGEGCSIKSGLGYVQNPDYGNPNAGQGASNTQKQCCTNAFNMCHYNGDQQSTNYANVVLVAQRSCKSLVSSTDKDTICAFYNDARNCGEQGMNPIPA